MDVGLVQICLPLIICIPKAFFLMKHLNTVVSIIAKMFGNTYIVIYQMLQVKIQLSNSITVMLVSLSTL